MASDEYFVSITSFGKWSVSVNGTVGESIHSRLGRQILVAFSLTSDWIARETLINELWPTAPDISKSRRRLTKELSRIQSCVGIRLWSADRETVRVESGVNLVSDVGQLIDGLEVTARFADPVREAARLQVHVGVIERGMLLPGHFDPWTCDLRNRVEQLEIGVRRSLVELLGLADGLTALRHARRWAELDPFSDQAHATVVHLTRVHIGSVAADQYQANVEELYRKELNVDPAGRFDVPPATGLVRPEAEEPSLPSKVRALKQKLESKDLKPADRIALVLELDDVLRLIGHHHERAKLLPVLERQGVGLDVRGWREVEVATVIGDLDQAHTLTEKVRSSEGPTDQRSASMLDLLEAVRLHATGKDRQAVERLETVLAADTSLNVKTEARLFLTSIYDALGKVDTALEHAVAALEDVSRGDLRELEAGALATLSFALARGIYATEAELHVNRALDLAKQSGSDRDLGAVNHALAYVHYISRRFTASHSYASTAADIYRRSGDVHLFARSAHCAGLAARVYGDLAGIGHHVDALRSLGKGSTLPIIQVRTEILDSCLHFGLRRFEQSAVCLEKALDLLCGTELELWRIFTTSMLIRSKLHTDGQDEALRLAKANMARVHDVGFPPRQVEWVEGDLGCALIAAGDVRHGFDVLNGILGHGNPGQILFALKHAYRFDAATSLGDIETARATQRTAWLMLETLREDLTSSQWDVARRNSEFVRPLLGIVDDDLN